MNKKIIISQIIIGLILGLIAGAINGILLKTQGGGTLEISTIIVTWCFIGLLTTFSGFPVPATLKGLFAAWILFIPKAIPIYFLMPKAALGLLVISGVLGLLIGFVYGRITASAQKKHATAVNSQN